MDESRLKKIPLFSNLSDEEAHRLAAFATESDAFAALAGRAGRVARTLARHPLAGFAR